jgi:hypothetical protein
MVLRPALRAFGQCRENVIEAALLAGDLLGHIGHVRDAPAFEHDAAIEVVENPVPLALARQRNRGVASQRAPETHDALMSSMVIILEDDNQSR